MSRATALPVGLLPLLLAGLLPLLLAAPRAAAGEALVCVALPTAAAGPAAPAAAALPDAWRLEQRKAGRPGAALVVVDAPDACPPAAALRVVLGADGRAAFVAADGAAFERDLARLAPAEQAQAVARAALEALGAAETAPLPFRAPAPPVALARAGAAADDGGPPALRWGLAVGGAYLLQPAPGAHRGALQVELQGALLDEALLLALRFDWAPAQALAGAAAPAELGTLGLSARAAWGWRLGAPLALRAGAGLGAERRALAVRPATRLDTIDDVRWAFVATAGLELEWAPTDHLRAAFELGARVTPWGTGARWQGAAVYEAPIATGTAAIRLGWWFR
jgi:hypothetical protein